MQHLQALVAFRREPQAARELLDLLLDLASINLCSYIVPAVRQLATLPAHRKLMHSDMGTSATLCTLATLIYRMRQQEANWHELRFLYLQMENFARTIAVIEDGLVVDALGETGGAAVSTVADTSSEPLTNAAITAQAFWEGLEYDLAGLRAIHHLEDIVGAGSSKEAVIARLEDTYQLYHFPQHEYEQAGFEAATGAALLAEGLYRPGLAAEIVERLQLSHACNRVPGQALSASHQAQQ